MNLRSMENTLTTVQTFRAAGSAADNEATWLAAARAGESWALESFYRTYVDAVHALCFRMLGSAHDAEDAVQSVFGRAFRALPRFRGDSTAKTWLYRIAMNECVSALRKRRQECPPLESAECTDPDVVERATVHAALLRLSTDNRSILVLRYWEELACEEIAAVLQISVSAAKMRLHRARIEFRKHYEGDV